MAGGAHHKERASMPMGLRTHPPAPPASDYFYCCSSCYVLVYVYKNNQSTLVSIFLLYIHRKEPFFDQKGSEQRVVKSPGVRVLLARKD
jgi:hypothetical protein